MSKLLDLLTQHNNYDEVFGGTDKEHLHHYVSEFYEAAFEPFQHRAINFLEIGIAGGASLKLWRDYFSQANIYAVDHQNKLHPSLESYLPRLNVFFQNGYSKSFADSLPNFDIIIDDGPHTMDSQADCLRLYIDKLNPGGILVIEDIAAIEFTNTYKQLVGNLEYQIIDTRTKYNRYDNIMFIVRK